MKLIAIVALLAVAGCALPSASAPESFDVASREPVCARQCLGQYSVCTSGMGESRTRFVVADILASCKANTQQCLSTCPAR